MGHLCDRWEEKKEQSVQSLEVAEGTVAQQTNEGAFKMYTQTSLIKDKVIADDCVLQPVLIACYINSGAVKTLNVKVLFCLIKCKLM